jgi:hypothetical protein
VALVPAAAAACLLLLIGLVFEVRGLCLGIELRERKNRYSNSKNY